VGSVHAESTFSTFNPKSLLISCKSLQFEDQWSTALPFASTIALPAQVGSRLSERRTLHAQFTLREVICPRKGVSRDFRKDSKCASPAATYLHPSFLLKYSSHRRALRIEERLLLGKGAPP